MDKLKIGILGCGAVATIRHAPSYYRDKRCKIVAVMCPTESHALTFSKKFKIPKYYTNIDNFLDNQLDIVNICTPPFTHFEIAMKCLKQGFNVFIEKPMTLSTVEAEILFNEAEKNNKKICVSHNFLFSHSMLKIKELIKNNKIGKISSIWAVQISNLKRKYPKWYPELIGGLVCDESPHMLYMLKYFLPNIKIDHIVINPIKKLKQQPQKIEVFFSDGEYASAKYIMDFSCARDEWYIYIISEKAYIKIDLFRDTVITLQEGGKHDPIDVLKGSLSDIYQNSEQVFKSGYRLIIGNQLYGHDNLIHKFIDCVIENKNPPVKKEEIISVVHMHEKIINLINEGENKR